MDPKDLQSFSDPAALAKWLRENPHATELWVRIYKVACAVQSVTWQDCVIEALRFGWIDGIKKSLDPDSYAQRLTPRKQGSGWSKRNCDHCDALIASGRMTDRGLAQVLAAKQDGRWQAAYSGSSDMIIPEWFLTELRQHPAALAQFETLNRQNLFTIYYRLHTAKTDKTRASRTAAIVATLTAGKTFQ